MRPIPQILEFARPIVPPPYPGMGGWGGGSDDPGSLDLAAWGRRLARHWWIVVLAVAAAMVAAAAWLHHTPPVYESVATVRVEQERRPLLPDGAAASGAEDIRALEMVKTIEQGMISQNNLRRVIARLQLAEDPHFSHDRSEPGVLRTLSRQTTAELRRGTRLIDVRVEDTDPERACQLAAAVAAEFITATDHEARAAASAKAAQLREHLQRLESSLRSTEARIAVYHETHRGLPLDDETSPPTIKARDLAARLAQVAADRTRLDAALQEIAALGPTPDVDAVLKVQGVPASEDVTSLKANLAQKEAEFARLQKRYLFRHPKYIQAATELDALRRQIGGLGAQAASTLAAAAAQLSATEDSLRDQLAQAEDEALAVERFAGPLRVLQAQRLSDQTSMEALQAQLQLAEVAAAAAPAAMVLADAPMVAARPIKPQPLLVLTAAGLVGGLSGFGLVLLRVVGRRGFESVEEMERVLQLPVLAAVPADRASPGARVVLDHADGERVYGSVFRALGAALAVLPCRRDQRTVAFISGRTGEGTSFIAINHAMALARQGYRTLLIDGNLHAPALDAAFFGSPNPDGLAQFLEGRGSSGQACRPTHFPGLYLLSAGRPSRHPSDLVRPEALRLLLNDASRWFHRVVIDAPALNVAADGLVLAQAADMNVLVIHEPTASRHHATAAIQRLAIAGVRPAGLVVHASRRAHPESVVPAVTPRIASSQRG